MSESFWETKEEAGLWAWMVQTKIRSPQHAKHHLDALVRLSLSETLRLQVESLMNHFWDPDRLLPPLVRFLDGCRQVGIDLESLALNELAPVLTHSPVLARTLLRQPELAISLVRDKYLERPKKRTMWMVEAQARLANVGDPDVFDKELRRFRNKEMLRIAARELRGEDVRETALELSFLAEICLEVTVQFWRRQLTLSLGAPRLAAFPDRECRFVVMGMGKLGGRELNYSSDIDLIYFYEADDEAEPMDSDRSDTVDLHRWFSRLSELVSKSISRVTEDGFCFRVDLGLRPEGKFGPICNSVAAAETYYESWGHPWERVAWVRARPVAGDLDLGVELIGSLSPFIWRKTLDNKAIDDIRRIKTQINDRARRRHAEGTIPKAWDVKLGEGGIREIEFFANAFQLIYGGKMPVLREPSTVKALEKLVYAGLVPAKTGEVLRDAYLLFRRVEHRIQIAEERQTHSLPTTPAAIDALARSLGVTGTENDTAAGLTRMLDTPRRAVATTFEQLLIVENGPDNARQDVDSDNNYLVSVVLSTEHDDRQRTDAMVALGYGEPLDDRSNYEPLEVIKSLQRRPTTPFHPRHASRFEPLCRDWVREAGLCPQPVVALRHLRNFVWNLRENTAIYDILQRVEPARRLLLTLFASSAFLARAVARRPYLVDSLVFQGRGQRTKTKTVLETELAAVLMLSDDLESKLNLCRRVQTEEMVRIALLDLAGDLSITEVGEQLSDLADVLVAAVLECATAELRNRGRLVGAPLAVFALGRWGTREMGFASDLDVLFLYSDTAEDDGSVERQQIMARLAQTFITHMTCMLAEGTLYSVDTRLRPDGGHGALVSSVPAFLRYHRDSNRSDWWEKQALLKARFVAGDKTCITSLESTVTSVVFQAVPPADLAVQMHRLRRRLLDEVAHENAKVYNLKFGRGGLVEIEFIVQLYQLQLGYSHPELRHGTMLQLLWWLGSKSCLAPMDCQVLTDAWRFYRRLENRIRLQRDRSADEFFISTPEVDQLARQMGYGQVPGRTAAEQLVVHYNRHADAVHALYSAHFIERCDESKS